jgi:hypothetical protein
MAYETIHIGGQNILHDPATGALVVIAQLEATPTIDIGDIQVKNAAGAVINPATAEGQASILDKLPTGGATAAKQDAGNASLDSIAAATLPRTVVATKFAAVDNTVNGQTYATLKGSAIEATTQWLEVYAEHSTDDVRVNPLGNASATVGVKIRGVKQLTLAQAATAKFFSTAGTNVCFEECKRG